MREGVLILGTAVRVSYGGEYRPRSPSLGGTVNPEGGVVLGALPPDRHYI
jgi:hypothetical protein